VGEGVGVGTGVALGSAKYRVPAGSGSPPKAPTVGEATAIAGAVEIVADGAGSAKACGATTMIASIAMTKAVAAIRTTAGDNRFKWFL
jgi:hypothetical protein